MTNDDPKPEEEPSSATSKGHGDAGLTRPSAKADHPESTSDGAAVGAVVPGPTFGRQPSRRLSQRIHSRLALTLALGVAGGLLLLELVTNVLTEARGLSINLVVALF